MRKIAENPQTPAEEIVAIAIDLDGCIFNDDYIGSEEDIPDNIFERLKNNESIRREDHLETKDILTSNRLFLVHLSALVGTNEAIVLCGSTRQDFAHDRGNAVKLIRGEYRYTHSATEALTTIVDELKKNNGKAELDTYLLADKNEDGKNFSLIQKVCDSYKPPKEFEISEEIYSQLGKFDFFYEKIHIVYAHVHRLAVKYPDKKITYHFYDDRENILEGIFKFFKNEDGDEGKKVGESLLVHKNVTIELHHYQGEKETPAFATPYATLHGTGDFIDADYKETIKHFTKKGVRYLHQLKKFPENRAAVFRVHYSYYCEMITNEIERLRSMSNPQFTDLIEKLEQLKDHAEKIKNKAITRAVALLKLGNTVVRQTKECIKGGKVAIKKEKEQALQTSKKKLTLAATKFKHRDNIILRGLLVAFTVVLLSPTLLALPVLPFALASVTKYKDRHGHWPFFKAPKSRRCTEELNESFKKVFAAPSA